MKSVKLTPLNQFATSNPVSRWRELRLVQLTPLIAITTREPAVRGVFKVAQAVHTHDTIVCNGHAHAAAAEKTSGLSCTG